MAAEDEHTEPRGFGEHVRGLASENAHQQGWGLNQEERTKPQAGVENTFGGTDYDYGARDFGDEPLKVDAGSDAEVDKAREVLRKEGK